MSSDLFVGMWKVSKKCSVCGVELIKEVIETGNGNYVVKKRCVNCGWREDA